jgi:replicative DNA helicase
LPEYRFTPEFQEELAAIVISDSSVIHQLRQVILPEYFSDPVLRKVITIASEFYGSYRAAPSMVEFMEVSSSILSIEERKRAKKLFRVHPKNPKFIVEEATNFAQYQAMKEAILNSTDLIESLDNRVQIRKLITDALKVGADTKSLGSNLLVDRQARYAHRARHGINENKVSTGIPGLDAAMEGGPDVGELWLVMAPPKGFKTGFLLNMGAAAVAQRKRVLHITLEVAEARMMLRYERRFSGLSSREIIDDHELLEKVLKRIEKLKGGLIVKGFPAKSITVEGIHNHIEMIKAEGFIPDLIIVDYIDLVKPSITGEVRHQLSDIMANLRGLGAEHKVPIWSASQVNRKAVNKQIIRKEDIAEDFGKIAICDGAVALCQTIEEREVKPAMMRIYMVANREGTESETVAYCEVDYAKMRIKPIRREHEHARDPRPRENG